VGRSSATSPASRAPCPVFFLLRSVPHRREKAADLSTASVSRLLYFADLCQLLELRCSVREFFQCACFAVELGGVVIIQSNVSR